MNTASEELLDLIDTERRRLMHACAILRCASVALDQPCSNTRLLYMPDVLEAAFELVEKSIDHLDSLHILRITQSRNCQRTTHCRELDE